MAFTCLSFFLFFIFFFFLINSLELPGALGCCRADRSHFRPVLALKGGGHDECVLGAQSPPSSVTWGWQHPGLLLPGLLGLCHPTRPSSPLAAEAKTGREEKLQEERVEGEEEEW